MDIITKVDESKFAPEKQFIAYIDILGYEHLMKKYGISKMAAIIDTAISKNRVTAEAFTRDSLSRENMTQIGATKTDMKIEQKVFSDNFFFCTKNNWFDLLSLIPLLQVSLMDYGIFIRGALCYGDIYYGDSFICGVGLINAYKLESIVAIYPRILIDNSFYDQAGIYLKKSEMGNAFSLIEIMELFVNKDYDYNSFIDYLKHLYCFTVKLNRDMNYNSKSELQRESFSNFISFHRRVVSKNLHDYEGNMKIHSKYLWCKRYHNNFCEEHGYMDYIIT